MFEYLCVIKMNVNQRNGTYNIGFSKDIYHIDKLILLNG